MRIRDNSLSLNFFCLNGAKISFLLFILTLKLSLLTCRLIITTTTTTTTITTKSKLIMWKSVHQCKGHDCQWNRELTANVLLHSSFALIIEKSLNEKNVCSTVVRTKQNCVCVCLSRQSQLNWHYWWWWWWWWQ